MVAFHHVDPPEMENSLFLTPPQAHLISSISNELLEEQGYDQMARLFCSEISARAWPDGGCDGFMALGGGVLGEEEALLDSSALEQALGFYPTSNSDVNPCPVDPLMVGSGDGEEAFEEKDEDGDCSGTTTTTTTTTPGTRRDRARTLVSERKRRGRMKERLYELRSLVPNITKMDKASIIGDAIMYIKGLQNQARSLTEEISRLESSSTAQTFQPPLEDQRPAARAGGMGSSPHAGKREILQFTACEMGDQRFYLRMECNKGVGTPAALYRAMEAFTFIHLESSSFSTTPLDRHEVIFSLKVRECGGEMSASTLKLWVMTALMNEGFEFKMGTCS